MLTFSRFPWSVCSYESATSPIAYFCRIHSNAANLQDINSSRPYLIVNNTDGLTLLFPNISKWFHCMLFCAATICTSYFVSVQKSKRQIVLQVVSRSTPLIRVSRTLLCAFTPTIASIAVVARTSVCLLTVNTDIYLWIVGLQCNVCFKGKHHISPQKKKNSTYV